VSGGCQCAQVCPHPTQEAAGSAAAACTAPQSEREPNEVVVGEIERSGERGAGADDSTASCDAGAPERGWERQAGRRRAEDKLRKQAVAFRDFAGSNGWSTHGAAAALDLPRRTLADWRQRALADDLHARPRGRPPSIASADQRAQVLSFLDRHGPTISLSTLRAEHAGVARAELSFLRGQFRDQWSAAHPIERCELDWLRPGSVWAMDFSHPPHLIDGCYPAILNVRDLASRQQLLWLAVEREDAATVVEALGALFTEHGPPLVMKCDNGPGFRAQTTKRMLYDWRVFTLYSPPRCARYNGACERANRTLKELTAHMADQAGRANFWTSDDLHAARLRANRLTRPWGPCGSTPEESWTARGELSLDERENMWQHLGSEIAAVCAQRGIDAAATLPHYTQTEIERIAAEQVLQDLDLLHVTRRRIAPVF
jgi:transposase InsO family protein